MTTPTQLNWKATTPEHRNNACACFMPPSDCNQILSWHLHIGKQDMGPLTVQTKNEADAWLSIRQSSREHFERSFGKFCPWDQRLDCQIVEHRRSLRYSDTPGGAWTLMEELKRQGHMIAIAARAGATFISAERYNEAKPVIIRSGEQIEPKIVAFEGSEPFSELAAMLFLTVNGCQIIQ